jgi:ubiquinone biosynthesis protein UbiJ
MLLESPFAATINRLLDSEPWAREQLAPFAGETLELRAPPLPALRFGVVPGGRLEPAPMQGEPSAAISLGPAAFAALPRGEQAFIDAVEVTGKPDLASALKLLLRHLRWDFEEDLATLAGDVAAHRVAGTARDFAAWQADAARRIAEGLAAYAADERRLLVRRAELAALAQSVERLSADLERLERRVRSLG